jgi:hypothetical protein
MKPWIDPSGTGAGRTGAPAGFSFVELLVASAILGITIIVAVVAFSTLTTSPGRGIGEVDVQLPAAVMMSHYGISNPVVAVPHAPAYGELLRAEAMRDLLHNDLGHAVAVYCLARSNTTSFRPGAIALGTGFDPRRVVRPAEFRALLGGGGSGFTDYTGPATGLPNTSLFIFEATNTPATGRIRAIYEMDVTEAINPPGLYASVRRYTGSALTAFYHVFYVSTNTNNFANNFMPPAVFFDRQITTNGTTADRFRRAQNMPFYFLWWPDPATERFRETNTLMPDPGQPRRDYHQMADRTSFFFVIPAFPPL